MTNFELLRLFNVLEALRQPQQPLATDFALAAAINVKTLRPLVEAINETLAGPWDDVITPFNQDEAQVLSEHVILPPGAEVQPGVRYAVKDQTLYAAAQQELRARHPGLDAAVKARDERTAEIYAKEAAVRPLEMADRKDLPPQLSIDFAEALMPMLRPVSTPLTLGDAHG